MDIYWYKTIIPFNVKTIINGNVINMLLHCIKQFIFNYEYCLYLRQLQEKDKSFRDPHFDSRS